MSTGTEAEVLAFPIRRTRPGVLPEQYARARAEGISRAQLPTGEPIWVITRYDYARAVLSDPNFSADKTRDDFPKLTPNGLDKLKYFAPFLVNLDGAAHRGARKAVLDAFTPQRVAELRPRIQEVADDVVDEFLSESERPTDLVARLAFPAAWKFQEQLLGIPVEVLATVRQHTRELLLCAGSEEEEVAAADRLHQHLTGVLRGKESHLGDDLVSQQIRCHRTEKGEVDHFELASLVQLLAVGSHNSIATMLSLGALALLTHPRQRAVLAAEPERMVGAVHEMLRYYSINDATPLRLCLEDVTIGGTLIRAGEGVAVPLLPPNRDPHLCPAADRLDLLRADRPRHIAFGSGPHRCLAYSLAPAQLELVLTTLLRRAPELRLAVEERELTYRYHSPQAFGPEELPVTW
ncbi:cytochrome P450 [Streptomyces olivaceiscleroticus]|uniref:Cytochrome P450 n=1 Tax=Streptomyces olivaceiscleroticus TaxID=68245 RepID=A0ABP3L747_9ACTN